MQMTRIKKSLSLILCIVLIAAAALFTTGCNDNNVTEEPDSQTSGSQITVLGEGQTEISVTVTDVDGNESAFEVHTDEKTVGDALVAVELIAGEMGDYGLYVTTVNGITLDYDTDGKYWAFYIDGEYAMTGVDATDITEGASYAFKAE